MGFVAGIFLISVSLQAGFAVLFLWALARLSVKDELKADALPISVLICARNEAGPLARNLPAVLAQDYEGIFEVVVVDDASADGTAEVLRKLQGTYPQLRVVRIGPDEVRTHKGKKYALLRGTRAARFDHFLLTDADCVPASPRWISEMAAGFRGGKEIVSGFGDYEAMPGLLNTFIRWETRHSFIQATAFAALGLPYMAVGRNMGCTREALELAARSEIWDKTPSGDDDLLVQLAGTPHNYRTVCRPEAFTYSVAATDWRQWMWQKQRHLSTGKYYRFRSKVGLAAYAGSHALLWATFLILAASGNVMALLLMGVRGVIAACAWALASRKLETGRSPKVWTVLFRAGMFDLGWLCYNFAFSPYIFWKNKQQWKKS